MPDLLSARQSSGNAIFLRLSVLFQRNHPKSDRNTTRIISDYRNGVKDNYGSQSDNPGSQSDNPGSQSDNPGSQSDNPGSQSDNYGSQSDLDGCSPGRPFLTSRKEPVSIDQETHVREMGFLLAVFAIIEHLNKSELPPTSKKLIVIYVNEASELSMAEKARAAVRRYSHTVLPSLESIREKSRTKKLDALDHLVLKLEYEASRLSR